MSKSVPAFVASAVAAGLIVIGLILNVVAVATDFWITGLGFTLGLWRTCSIGFGCSTLPIDGIPDWLHAVRALTVAAGTMALVITAPVLVVTTILQKPITSVLAIAAALLPPVLLAAGIFVWVGGVESDFSPALPITYGWSFILGCVGVGFYFFGAVALGVQSVATCQHDSGMV